MAPTATERDTPGAGTRTNDDRDGHGSLGTREAPSETGDEAGGGSFTSNPPATRGHEAQDEWHGPLSAATCATDVKKGRPFFGGISKITTRKGRERSTYVGHIDPEDALTLEEALDRFPQLEGRIEIVSTDPRTGEDIRFDVDVGERPDEASTSDPDEDVGEQYTQLAAFENARTELQEEIQQARKRARRQEERADDLQEELDRMNRKLREARQEADEARREKNRELRNQRREYRDEIGELEEELRARKSELADIESENQRLERKVEHLEDGQLPGGDARKWLDHPLAERFVGLLENVTGASPGQPSLSGSASPSSNGTARPRSRPTPGPSRAQQNGQDAGRAARPNPSEPADQSPENTESMGSRDEISQFIENSVSMAQDVLSEQASTTAREFAGDFNETVAAMGGQVGATAYAEIAERIARFAVENGVPTGQVSSALEPVLRPLLSGSMAETYLRNSSPSSAAQTLFAFAGRDPDEAIKNLVIEVLGQLKQRL